MNPIFIYIQNTGSMAYWDVNPATESLAARLATVRERIARAADRARRDPAGITLLAVTKVFPASVIRDAYTLGLREFGENYVQEFETKAPLVADLAGARIHLIGHLQSNKSAKAASLFQVIQTVDSAKLAQRLDAAGTPLEIMLEVKLSEEQAKSGAAPEELPELIAAVRECANLKLTGLMTMPPWSDDAEAARPYFRRLRELAERHALTGLSIGMSHDFEAAIEEGATCVRVGTALFGRRKKA
jgi:pyridoxal phosphate enzyme (YggS family)